MDEKELTYEEYCEREEHNKKLRQDMIDELSKYDDFKRIERYLPKLHMESYDTYLENYQIRKKTLGKCLNEEIGVCESKN